MVTPWMERLSGRLSLRGPSGIISVTSLVCIVVLPLLAKVVVPSPNLFIIRSYLSSNYPDQSFPGKCLDFGRPSRVAGALAVGSPIFISDCNGGASQLFDVQDNTVNTPTSGVIHEAILHGGGECVGTLSPRLSTDSGSAGSIVPPEAGIAEGVPLGLTDCSRALVLKLDGDSMVADADHNYVAEVKDGNTANGTPVVLGRRRLSDIEFWTFTAADGSVRRPTGAFVSAADWGSLVHALQNASPGTVVEIGSSFQIGEHRLSPSTGDPPPGLIQVPSGVTIRGDRHGLSLGPEIYLTGAPNNKTRYTLFQIIGDDVRLTGLRIKGPSRDFKGNPASARAIWSNGHDGLVIDHNDMSDWMLASVDLYDGNNSTDPSQCSTPPAIPSHKVFIVRNFIHHDWYGVAVGYSAFAEVDGNVFVTNVHSITSDGTLFASYNAVDNLLLSDSPVFDQSGDHGADLDIHGNGVTSHNGGLAGSGVDAAHNTFLGTNRLNFDTRGTPCAGTFDRFRGNIVLQDAKQSIQWEVTEGDTTRPDGNPPNAHNVPNWLQLDASFGQHNPTWGKLGVGDFDGDGKDDLFLATGEAWYYSPGGKAEWRFLSEKKETISNLLFGDFDADGRTDVFTQIGDDWMVSWGGISPWQKINQSKWRMTDFFIADFVGDRRADVFFARGDQWFVSDGGRGPFVPYAMARQKVSELRFGDFDGDKKTDVLGILDNQYKVVYAKPDAQGNRQWQPLRSALSTTVAPLFVADFDGNGISDIAIVTKHVGRLTSYEWQICVDGKGPPTPLSHYLTGVGVPVAIGKFDDIAGADFLFWENVVPPSPGTLEIVSSGLGKSVRQSRQDMR